MNTLTVQNRSLRPVILNLARGVDYGDAFLPARIPFDELVVHPSGLVAGVKSRTLAQPASISWLPGETRQDVPAAVASLEDFRKATAAGILRLV